MYEIEFVEIIAEQGFSLSRRGYETLRQTLSEKDLPEYNLLDPSWLKLGLRGSSTAEVLVPRFLWWHGKSTPSQLEIFLQVVLPSFQGSADVVFFLREKTVHLRGYRVRGGVVSKHPVLFSLGSSL